MRTLKKTLAIVLVLTMMFSLCVSASAFSDQEEIQNELAVNVLVELGVINGMPDGSFDPTGTLTRAQAAKMICCALGVADYIEQCPTDFDDVAESHWASGYIAWCADNGIIDGYGDGKFGPSDVLTGYQWAKMLLVAFDLLPVNQDGTPAVSLTGSSWMVNTAIWASNNGIWAGDEDSNKKAELSRDFACLHLFNILKNGLELTDVLDRDAFGAPVANTVVLGDVEAEEPIVVSYEEVSPVVTYTSEVTRGDILKDLGVEKAEEATFTVYVDGVVVATNAAMASDLKAVYPKSGNGTYMAVYAADDAATEDVAEYELIVVNTYAAQLDEKTDIVAADEEKEIPASVKLGAYTYETDAFADGDIVLYTVDKSTGKVITAEKAAVAEGKVTSASSDGSFKVDGVAAEFAKCSLTATAKVSSTAMNIYKDANGYIVAIATIKGEVEEPVEEPELEYAWGYMTNYKSSAYVPAVEGDFWTDTTGSAAIDAVEKIEITNAAGETKIYDGAYEYIVDEKTEEVTGTTFVNDTGATAGLVQYALTEDGKVADIVYYAENVRNYAFVTGNATMTGAKVLLTADTLAFVVGEEVTAYTGYQNIPSFDKSVNGLHENGAWTVLVIAEEDLTEEVEQPVEPADPTESVAYVLDAAWELTVAQDKDGKDFDVYNYTVVVGTEEVAIKATSELGLVAGKMYTLSTAEDGYTTVKAEVEANVAEVVAVQATYFKAGETVYNTTDKTVYYVIGETVAAADGIVASDKEQTVATAYIFTDAKTGAVTTVYYTITAVEAE